MEIRKSGDSSRRFGDKRWQRFYWWGANQRDQTTPHRGCGRPPSAPAVPESQQIAEAVLGRQAEVHRHMEILARNWIGTIARG